MLKMCFTVLKMKQKRESCLKYWITELHNHVDGLGGWPTRRMGFRDDGRSPCYREGLEEASPCKSQARAGQGLPWARGAAKGWVQTQGGLCLGDFLRAVLQQGLLSAGLLGALPAGASPGASVQALRQVLVLFSFASRRCHTRFQKTMMRNFLSMVNRISGCLHAK